MDLMDSFESYMDAKSEHDARIDAAIEQTAESTMELFDAVADIGEASRRSERIAIATLIVAILALATSIASLACTLGILHV